MSARLFARAAGAALSLVAALIVAAPASAHHSRPTAGPEIVVDWNKTKLAILAVGGLRPITVHPPRTLALVHLAMHDAINVVEHDYEPYLVHEDADGSPSAAAIAAASGVLKALYP